MSKSSTNIITHGYSGKVGDQFVMKNYGGITVIAMKPTFTKPWSEKQKACRRNFGRAAHAAALELSKPETRERYAKQLKPRQNILNLVVSDKLKGVDC